ncbi:MAG: S-methyl-5-thioribose-1-phosphate isomerase, partial [Alphaproteobacteria bacterium]|nr:S-methyl-5-thioribose-1-phosphate isomerase [Alphaproteobacteria bacterium]
MKVDGRPFRTIWVERGIVRVIDQTLLPHRFVVLDIADLAAAA